MPTTGYTRYAQLALVVLRWEVRCEEMKWMRNLSSCAAKPQTTPVTSARKMMKGPSLMWRCRQVITLNHQSVIMLCLSVYAMSYFPLPVITVFNVCISILMSTIVDMLER